LVSGLPPRSADDGGGTPLGVEGAKPPAFFGCVTLKPDWYKCWLAVFAARGDYWSRRWAV
jgi:hypothetical protein